MTVLPKVQLPTKLSVSSTELGAKPASAGFVVSEQEITLDLRGSSIVLRLTNSISLKSVAARQESNSRKEHFFSSC